MHFLTGLERVMPSSAILSSVPKAQQSAPTSPVIQKFPASLTSLQEPGYAAMSKIELEEVCLDVFETQLKITSEASSYYEESTHIQSLSPL